MIGFLYKNGEIKEEGIDKTLLKYDIVYLELTRNIG